MKVRPELSVEEKERLLVAALESLDSVMVAYSGGVDSSLLSYYARKVLGAKSKIVIAVSPSLALEELEAARSQAEQFRWDLIEIQTAEVDKPEYQRNDAMRCYFCKSTLFEDLSRLAKKMNVDALAYGANMDDLRDFRPGHKAARENNVLSPLQAAGLDKQNIRELAKQAGLPSWDRPQAACLSSRFPTFEPVTIASLSQVERAERVLHSLAFRQVRVRHHGDLARIEVDSSELSRFSKEPELLAKITSELKQLGYKFVTLDLEGYRQGSSNQPSNGASNQPSQDSIDLSSMDAIRSSQDSIDPLSKDSPGHLSKQSSDWSLNQSEQPAPGHGVVDESGPAHGQGS